MNALWNDRYGMGVWIYDSATSCRNGYPDSQPFLVVGFRGASPSGKLDVSELGACARIVPNGRWRAHVDRCRSGWLAISYDPAAREYTGSYAFDLGWGMRRSGAFLAASCAHR